MSSGALENGWVPSAQVPLMFGGIISCGLPGDERSGQVNLPLYGTASMRMRFTLPQAEASLQIAVCADTVGSPTMPLTLDVYTDNGGGLGTHLSTAPIPVGSVSAPNPANGYPNWTGFVTLAGSFPAGLLWVVVSSQATSATNSYLIYLNFLTSWINPEAKAAYSPPPGVSGNSGSSVVWVKDASGTDLVIMPFGAVSDHNLVPMATWVAASSYQINCLVPWLSDFQALEGGLTANFVLTDLTVGTSLGTAPLTQYFNSHGAQGLVICQLPSVVDIIQGHEYQISVGPENYGGVVEGLIRACLVNPAKAGPGGVAGYWWGGIALGDFSQYRVLDYGGPTTITGQNGHGGIGLNTPADEVAVRFVPSATDVLRSFSVKTKSQSLSSTSLLSPPVFNLPGTPIFAKVYASNESAGSPVYVEPTGPALASSSVDSGQVPLDGWLTVSGFNYPVTAGTPVWVVFSSPTTTTGYDLQRNVSPWRFIKDGSIPLTTENAGASWKFFGQGPTELTWKATMASGATPGNPFDDAIPLPVDATSRFVAQPFVVGVTTTFTSVFAFQNTGAGFKGTLTVSIYPDNGSVTSPGPDMAGGPVSTGSFSSLYQYFYAGGFIPLTTPAVLTPGKWWKVYSSTTGAQVTVAYYWTRPTDPAVPAGLECLITSNGGATWSQYNGGEEVATTMYALGVQVESGTMPTPTSLSLIATIVTQ